MNCKILSVALLMSVNMVLPMIDDKEAIEPKQSPGEKQPVGYSKRFFEMINRGRTTKPLQEKEQMIKAECEQEDIKSERRKQLMMLLSMLLD